MQVRLLPNVSDPFPKKIARERLDGAIRLLRGEIAVISKESSAVYWMRLRDIVSFVVVANRTILGMERYGLFTSPSSAILTTHSRSAVILRKIITNPYVAAETNDLPPPMKNERPKLGTPTETQATTARTQIAAQNSELASNDSTGYRNPESL